MKKSLLALAVVGAFAGAAQAQTAITVYGSFDGGIRHRTNVNAAGDSQTTMGLAAGGGNGLYNSNRLGFRGTEDLGGGLSARFTLESGFNTGTGGLDNAANLLFNRTASVGLAGAFGSVDLGRQYSVNFRTIGLYDPFAYKYTSIVPVATQGGLTRLNNNVQYAGAFGPVTVRAEYAFGEQPDDFGAGATQAIGASYSASGITVGAAYTAGERADGGGVQRDMDNWTIGAAYATSAFRVAGGYAVNSLETATVDTDVKNIWLGGSFNVSPAAAISAAFYRTSNDTAGTTGRRNLLIVGATYALSKRTNLYAAIDNSRLRGNAVTVNQTSQSGVSFGLNHLF